MFTVLRRFEEGVGVKRKPGSGRPVVKLPPKQDNKMIKEILRKVGVSQPKMGRKYGIFHHTVIGKVLKKNKIDWIKQNWLQSTIQVKRRGSKSQQEFLGETFFLHQDQQILQWMKWYG